MKIKRIVSLLLLVCSLTGLVLSASSCAKTVSAAEHSSRPGKGSGISIYDEATTDEPTPAPPTGKTVIVDPGHGFKDSGAGAVDYELGEGVDESVVTLQIARVVKQELIKLGYNVIMTHEGELTPEISAYASDNLFSAEERAVYFDTLSADCLVSIHLDIYAEDTSIRGTRVHVQEAYDENWNQVANYTSAKYAETVIDTLNSMMGDPVEASLAISNFAVLRGRSIPAILIEVGFISNPEDAKNLVDPDWQTKFANALATGIDKYFKEES